MKLKHRFELYILPFRGFLYLRYRERTWNGPEAKVERRYSDRHHLSPVPVDNVLCTSHAVKSACLPKGWCTSFGLTSAKLLQFFLLSQRNPKKYMIVSKKMHFVLVTYWYIDRYFRKVFQKQANYHNIRYFYNTHPMPVNFTPKYNI